MKGPRYLETLTTETLEGLLVFCQHEMATGHADDELVRAAGRIRGILNARKGVRDDEAGTAADGKRRSA